MMFNLFNIVQGVKQPQVLFGGHNRLENANLICKLADMHFIPEGVDTILAEGMVFKPVMTDLISGVNGNRFRMWHALFEPREGI